MHPMRWTLVRRGLAAGLSLAAGATAMNWWIDRQARERCFAATAQVPPRPVAIVLGARVHPNGTPSAALEDRLSTALDLYESGQVQTILVSGDAQAPEHDEPAAMQRWLVDRGVPAKHIVSDRAGYRTVSSMQRAAELYGVAGAIVCTQRFHLHRAVFLALRAGIDAVGAAADRRYTALPEDYRREFVAKLVAFVESYLLGRGSRSSDR